MATDSEDQIEWLRKSNQNDPAVKAQLKAAEGELAVSNGDDQKAELLFKQSIEAYDSTPETVGSLNNSGLVCFRLFQISKDQKDFDEGLRRLEKAVSLNPTDSILLSNTAYALANTAYADIVSKHLDQSKVKLDATLELMSFLYNSAAEKEAMFNELKSHRGMIKGMAMLKNVIVLAPKRPDPYSRLMDIYERFGDAKSAEQLLEQARNANPESDSEATIEYYQGTSDEDFRKQVTVFGQRVREKMALAQADSLEQACVVGMHEYLIVGQISIGDEVELDSIIAQVDKAYKNHPSHGITSVLVNLLLCRADKSLRAENASYKSYSQNVVRYLGGPYTVALAASRKDPLSALLGQNEDFKRALTIQKELKTRFPERRAPWEWALFVNFDKAETEKVVASLKEDKLGQSSRNLDLITSPASVGSAIAQKWEMLAIGNSAEAGSALDQCQKLGVDVPAELK